MFYTVQSRRRNPETGTYSKWERDCTTKRLSFAMDALRGWAQDSYERGAQINYRVITGEPGKPDFDILASR